MKTLPLKNFTLFPAQNECIGILSIPHSGLEIPEEFKPFLTKNTKDQIEDVDYKVDELVDIPKLTAAGISVLVSHIHRICVDLNRSSDLAVLNWKKNTQGKTLVTKEPEDTQEKIFLEKYYMPYYEILKTLIKNLSDKTKKVSFVDLHSMPSTPTAYHLKITPDQSLIRPDFCISDVIGKTCEKGFIDFITASLATHYPNVLQNEPYFGGNITRHIDQLFPEINNIQIEINRNIYMDENNKTLIAERVSKLKPILTTELLKFYQHFWNIYSTTH
jgi:N-formylglutamate amidohydrolase